MVKNLKFALLASVLATTVTFASEAEVKLEEQQAAVLKAVATEKSARTPEQTAAIKAWNKEQSKKVTFGADTGSAFDDVMKSFITMFVDRGLTTAAEVSAKSDNETSNVGLQSARVVRSFADQAVSLLTAIQEIYQADLDQGEDSLLSGVTENSTPLEILVAVKDYFANPSLSLGTDDDDTGSSDGTSDSPAAEAVKTGLQQLKATLTSDIAALRINDLRATVLQAEKTLTELYTDSRLKPITPNDKVKTAMDNLKTTIANVMDEIKDQTQIVITEKEKLAVALEAEKKLRSFETSLSDLLAKAFPALSTK